MCQNAHWCRACCRFCVPLIYYRYALSKGATVSAVDVEEVVDPSKNCEGDSFFRVSKHSIQRRGDAVRLHNYQNGSLAAISGKDLIDVMCFFSCDIYSHVTE